MHPKRRKEERERERERERARREVRGSKREERGARRERGREETDGESIGKLPRAYGACLASKKLDKHGSMDQEAPRVKPRLGFSAT